MRPLPMLPPASLSRTALDRNHSLRSAGIDAVWETGRARAVVGHRGNLLISRGGLHLLTREQVPRNTFLFYLGTDAAGDHFIGAALHDEGRAELDQWVGAQQARDAEAWLTDPIGGLDATEPTWMSLRDLGEQLDDRDVALATSLTALANWHFAHTHSPRSGRPTEPVLSGWVRRDPEAGSEHFPRTDPAVIMAVVHTDEEGEEHLLLGSNAMWPADRYSLLAGFVEPGETLESAVIREVQEEAGITVRAPRYVGSQPWPFPASLMLGFTAEADSMAARADDDEITALRWFTRTELRDAIAAQEVAVPTTVSIAGQILYSWLDNDSDTASARP
ncbi:MAG TPA: NAD(+) diphosphatase [Brevibacterium senegalense]|uniref:NAD(+) diphosphatase n=1 Tax=Brevibacterium senegalense TaxID=1033736 RepID=A0A921MCF1_9MICO|nr:NAD(+) diphosphatase [Brevibacterium senegalense]